MRLVMTLMLAMVLAGCTREADATATGGSPYPGWTRVHESTLRRRNKDVAVVGVLFAGASRALIPERAFGGPTDHMFLIDLDAATRRRLATPGMAYFTMLPAGDAVIVDPGYPVPGKPFTPHVRIGADGGSTMLQTLDVSSAQYGRPPDRQDAARMRQALEAGELGGLTRLDSWQRNSMEKREFFAPWLYVNGRWAVRINHVAREEIALMDRNVVGSRRLDWRAWTQPRLEGYRFDVQREPYHDYAGGSSNERILRLRVWRGDVLLHDLQPRDFAYHALVRGRRLWLVGESADYVDLP